MLLNKLKLLSSFTRNLSKPLRYSFSMARGADEIINQYTFNINPD